MGALLTGDVKGPIEAQTLASAGRPGRKQDDEHSAAVNDRQLAASLRLRLSEMEEALSTRFFPLDGRKADIDPEYELGVRISIRSALGYALEAIERGVVRPAPIPAQLLAQARLAVSNHVDLDSVLRRYFAGYAVLSTFIVQELEKRGALGLETISRQLAAQASLLEYVTEAVAEEYRQSSCRNTVGPQQRLAKQVEELLSDQRTEVPDMAYELKGWHLGAIGWGEGAAEGCRTLATQLDRQLFILLRDDGSVWAWLGGRVRPSNQLLTRILEMNLKGASIALGEFGLGRVGWRRTHLQAKAALPLALQRPEKVTRYTDVGLTASLSRDDLLRSALKDRYLTPLEDDRDDGSVARQTLRAYLRSGGNTSSAAAALGVDRHTVTNRLRAIEERIGCPLNGCLTEIDLALRLEA
jgi:hypothetical protein